MTQPRSGSEYGTPFLRNAIPIGDPRAAESFSQHNRLADDMAQVTRVIYRAWVVFPTALSNGAVTTGVSGKSVMGTASANLPTITRTGAGLYTVVYPTQWTDGAGTDESGVGQTEPIVLVGADGCVQSTSSFGRLQCTAVNQTVTVAVISNVSGTDTLSDLGGNVNVFVRCWS